MIQATKHTLRIFCFAASDGAPSSSGQEDFASPIFAKSKPASLEPQQHFSEEIHLEVQPIAFTYKYKYAGNI
jgi:hypothetical protein